MLESCRSIQPVPERALSAASLVAVVLALALPSACSPAHERSRSGSPPSGATRRSETIALGRDLFFDPRLSRTNRVACATCHRPELAFTDGRRFAVGVEDRRGTRNTPSLLGVAEQSSFFLDGRASSLEAQALLPIENPREMDSRLTDVIAAIDDDSEYRRRFQTVFGGRVTSARIAEAIAAFERTLTAPETPFDRHLAGDSDALSPAAERGMALFFSDARCSECHPSPRLTDGEFHNVGAADPALPVDEGRRAVTGRREDEGAFKTPALRNVSQTAPYMHNGRFKTLREVVEHYNFGAVNPLGNEHRDERLEVLYLSEDQVDDLVAFLTQGLTSSPESN